jgi:hypothetical protein|tara:strand:- start:318 stop:836 length:519 start_codon:yes stop_codon:yes gene_type:complete
MNKGVALGYGNLDDLELVGRAFGYDIYVEKEESTYNVIWVYDRNVTKRIRNWDDDMETRYRIAARVELSKERGAWHVDLLSVDSRYKGNNLAIKIYKFLMKKMDITLKAGTSQSAGGRYVWNKLSKTPGVVVYAKKSPYSKVIDFPKTGKRELVGKVFDLYDSNAEIFAVTG